MFKGITLFFLAIILFSCGGVGEESSNNSGEPNSSETGSSSGINVTPGDGLLIVSWSAGASRVSTALENCSYNVYIASESGLTSVNYESLADGAKYENAVTPFTIEGLDNNKSYYVLVIRICGSGQTDIGSIDQATPSAGGSGGEGANGDAEENGDVVTFGATVDINFPSAALKACVLKAGDKTEKIIFLTCEGKGVTSLKGLETLVNLVQLSALDNKITDLGPIKNLRKLEYLQLGKNFIADLSPLANLTNLTSLELANNKITDVNPLKNLKKVTRLDLQYNKLTDACALGGMTDLTWLDARYNNIVYAESLGALSKVKKIDLRNNVSPTDNSPSLHCDSLRMLIRALGSPPVFPDYNDAGACSWYFGNQGSPCGTVGLL